ncbi:hypothetical protein EKO23_11080 [Nocardioides guangzhouensis]|uniref:STAS domain-containing protein n=1 Tax=Nocardioides guangzhouensis TaxID=2497878 RepID=A0A4V1XZ83_9ACTN|nr:MEDS domain-containing protein [Nocardioides guangzhouensis]RYP85849.1 hypothetical protein EKO23_11080 [Nocardioides guangzhouensis]
MGPGSQHSSVDLGSLEPGTHLCAFHRDDGQLVRSSSTFVGQALAAGDQLLYVASDDQVDGLLAALADDVPVDDALASGQLLVRSFADAYGTRRPGDLVAIADGFRAAAERSREDGFPALRVAARMDGLVDLLGSPAEVLRWERASTALQREIGVSSVCHYDLRLTDDELVGLLVGEHDGLSPEQADAPLATFVPVGDPWGLRVLGEVDLSNRDALVRVLRSRAVVAPRLRVDLAGMTFADVGTLTRLHGVAAGLPGDGWLVLGDAPPVVRRALAVAGLGHERMRLEP